MLSTVHLLMLRQYAAGSWGVPAENQPTENILLAPSRKHLLVVAFPATGIPAPVMLKLVQQRPMISCSPQPLIPPPAHDVEARQGRQGAHIQEQPPPAQQHEQNFPPAMHSVEPHQNDASFGCYSNFWTSTRVTQPNHVIPDMMGYAAGEGSNPSRPGPSESYLGGPSAGMNAGHRMNLDGGQGESNDLQYGWTTGDADMSYSEASYRHNYYGFNQRPT